MDVIVLEGEKAIQAQASALEEFAESCGQPGAMSWLGFFLNGRNARWKHPYLVALVDEGADRVRLKAADLRAAALYFEYRPWDCRTGAFATDDITGIRSVVAPAGFRTQAAAIAMEALLKRGAHVVLTSYEHSPLESEEFGALLQGDDLLWTTQDRAVRKQLRLESTFDATLARLGKKTRTNMRYYRKRLLESAACEFVPDARTVVSRQELLEINTVALNPVNANECLMRFESSRDLPGGFLSGLRDSEGKWLSLVGGWRQGSTTVLHWQINAAGHEKDSIRTVMRTFLLEHEIERGAQRIVFYGGTTHSMSHSFEPEVVRDLIVRRASLRARLLHGLSRLVASPRSVTGRSNHLAASLRSEDLEWRSTSSHLHGKVGSRQKRSWPGRSWPIRRRLTE